MAVQSEAPMWGAAPLDPTELSSNWGPPFFLALCQILSPKARFLLLPVGQCGLEIPQLVTKSILIKNAVEVLK